MIVKEGKSGSAQVKSPKGVVQAYVKKMSQKGKKQTIKHWTMGLTACVKGFPLYHNKLNI
jgi:hypothetical protein